MHIRNYTLELAVFSCGAVVMIFELVGSRVLGPYVGTSIYVWTSLIGIVLGSLSLGYYIGGKISDQHASLRELSHIIFAAAVCLGLMTFIKDPFLAFLQTNIHSIRLNSLIAGVVLFSPTSVILGIVSPYTVKLKLNQLANSGTTIGNLYALSTVGSIVGTFLSGFYLIPHFGTDRLLLLLVVILTLTSLLVFWRHATLPKVGLILLALLSWPTILTSKPAVAGNLLRDVDTAYNRVLIHDDHTVNEADAVRIMQINSETHSAMYLHRDDLASEYSQYYNFISHFKPNVQKTLLLGGGAYSYPKEYLRRYATATLDVVEIDPMLTELAKTYFGLKEDPRLKSYHEDGRVFLNTYQGKYDVILGDAFTSYYSVPYQLTTKEATQKMFDLLTDDGIVILNTISSIEGDKGLFLRAEYATYKSIFAQVYLFPVDAPTNGTAIQNVILIALKTSEPPSFKSENAEINSRLQHLWQKPIAADVPVLTDDFVPVDYYMSKAL